MDYKAKIKALRDIYPIPINEALKLLKDNNGDVDACAKIFKEVSLDTISESTGCDRTTAWRYYEREKFDLNRTISMLKEDIYDENYNPIDGVTADGLGKVRTWIAIISEKDFASALDYKELPEVIRTLLLIPSLKHFGIAAQQARKIKDTIFNGYSDDLSIDEFIRRNVKLDDHADFQRLYKSVTLSLVSFVDELNRHRRNMK